MRIREIIRHRWFIAICTTIIGAVIGHYVIPAVNICLSDPQVEISYPISGEAVYWDEEGSTIIGNYGKLRQDQIYILLNPADTTFWWVQSQAIALNKSMWRAEVWYGTGPDEAGTFNVIALMTDESLNTVDKYDFGAFEGIRRRSSAVSNVATVVKIPTEQKIETGMIHVTSQPSGASFLLSGPVSYDGTTPLSAAGTPVGEYTITWGAIGGYKAPSSEKTTLMKDGTVSFIGSYEPEDTNRLTITIRGLGSTDPSPRTHVYDKETGVTITAIPAPGYTFHHWGGDISGSSTSKTVTIAKNIEVVAYFDIDYTRECEEPDEYTVGQTVQRTNASELKAHGSFGCNASEPFSYKAGHVIYNEIELDDADHLYLVLYYSKHSESTTSIEIYLDNELRATFIPENQGDWNKFTQTQPIDLGPITASTYTIKFSTDGQQYGVADLDRFSLSYFSD